MYIPSPSYSNCTFVLLLLPSVVVLSLLVAVVSFLVTVLIDEPHFRVVGFHFTFSLVLLGVVVLYVNSASLCKCYFAIC